MEFLGFLIRGDSIRPLPSKIDSLSKLEHPKDKTELRSLIGKLNFYARFIPTYSSLITPLRDLFRKNKDFQWLQYHQQAFESLLQALKDANPQVMVSRSEPKVVELYIDNESVEALLLTHDNKLINRTIILSIGIELQLDRKIFTRTCCCVKKIPHRFAT